MKKIEEEKSFAMDILQTLKKETKILLIINILLLIGFAYSCYDSVKIRDDIGTIEPTETYEIQQDGEGTNNYIGNDGDITYGAKN